MKLLVLILTQFISIPLFADYSINVSISEQRLYLLSDESIIRSYPISSSAYGEGQIENSLKTPLGKHEVKSKICLLYTSPSPRDATLSRMPSSA